jgi:formate hydrogenlyase subunit 4
LLQEQKIAYHSQYAEVICIFSYYTFTIKNLKNIPFEVASKAEDVAK